MYLEEETEIWPSPSYNEYAYVVVTAKVKITDRDAYAEKRGFTLTEVFYRD
jgi:hypothetical protein